MLLIVYSVVLVGLLVLGAGARSSPGLLSFPIRPRQNDPECASLLRTLDPVVTEALGGISWDSSKNSFAAHVTSSEETLWSSFYTSSSGNAGGGLVDGDTIFKVASISKTSTVYILLILQSRKTPTGLKLDDLVTKWIPELISRENNLGRLRGIKFL